MKTIMLSTIFALAVVASAGVGRVQADTIWHTPFKGAAYATQAEPVQQLTSIRTIRHGNHFHVRTAGKTQVIR